MGIENMNDYSEMCCCKREKPLLNQDKVAPIDTR
jgi:hypothetical protein